MANGVTSAKTLIHGSLKQKDSNMKKIPSLFVRDYEKVVKSFDPSHVSLNFDGSYGMGGRAEYAKGRFLATEQVTPGCEWVIAGEGIATRKWDGTAVLIDGATMYKRFDSKQGKTPPPNFIPCQEPDPITGHWPGWIPVNPNDPADKWICEAYTNTALDFILDNGTYEAVGPKINGNRDKWDKHELRKHGDVVLTGFPHECDYRSFNGIRNAFIEVHKSIEGIVFHHSDGRMCKVKRSDFGLKW